jgi:hypothetical protein
MKRHEAVFLQTRVATLILDSFEASARIGAVLKVRWAGGIAVRRESDTVIA